MKNSLNWFEIPVNDFDRAKKFYEAVFEAEMPIVEMPQFEAKMAFFPADPENGVGGSIIKNPDSIPSKEGPMIYLNGGDDLSAPLSRVEAAGGKIGVPKTTLGEHGFFATFTDTEGNLVGFHSPN